MTPALLPAQGLYIGPDARIVVRGAPILVLNDGALVNDGHFFAGGGTVLFTGKTATDRSFIGGAIPVSFYDLRIGKAANDVLLNSNTAVTGHITLDSGNLQLNNNLLDLGRSGSIEGERDVARITGAGGGSIRITAELNAPQAVNPGNIGLEITSPARLGWTVISRGHVPQTNKDGQSGIQRYFDLSPEASMDGRATLRFFYLEGELAGKDKNGLAVFTGPMNGNAWAPQGRDKADNTADWVLKNNIGLSQRITLAIPGPYTPGSDATRSAVQVYPNPSSGQFKIVLVCDLEKDRVMNVYDQRGRLLESRIMHCQTGVNTIDWNINGYASGTYFLSFADEPATSITIIKY